MGAVELYLSMAALPERTRLTFNHSTLDLIDRLVGVNFPPNVCTLPEIHTCLVAPEGWEWFNCVHEEEHYQSLVSRVTVAMDARQPMPFQLTQRSKTPSPQSARGFRISEIND